MVLQWLLKARGIEKTEHVDFPMAYIVFFLHEGPKKSKMFIPIGFTMVSPSLNRKAAAVEQFSIGFTMVFQCTRDPRNRNDVFFIGFAMVLPWFCNGFG